MLYIVKKRRKRNRRTRKPDVIRFSSGRVRRFCQVELSPVVLPVAMPGMAGSGVVDGIDDDPGSLRIFNSRIDVGILITWFSVVAVDSIGNQNHLTTWTASAGPTLGQIAQCKIGTGIHAGNAESGCGWLRIDK